MSQWQRAAAATSGPLALLLLLPPLVLLRWATGLHARGSRGALASRRPGILLLLGCASGGCVHMPGPPCVVVDQVLAPEDVWLQATGSWEGGSDSASAHARDGDLRRADGGPRAPGDVGRGAGPAPLHDQETFFPT